jgi:branched-chain amino acid transport system substrate-binding protein
MRAQIPRAIALASLVIAALPMTGVGASVRSGQSAASPVKVGMIYAVTSQIGGNEDARDAFQAAIKAFNKRGGVGANGAKIEGIICDTRGDPNEEVACAREMVDEGVVATLNDLTYNNPAGVVDVLEKAGIPRIGVGGTDVSEFGSSVSYPISAGVIAAYLGTAVGFKQDGAKKICLVRTDAPTGATFKGFLPVVHGDRHRHHLRRRGRDRLHRLRALHRRTAARRPRRRVDLPQ